MSAIAVFKPKFCTTCGVELIRKIGEGSTDFRVRKYCSRSCFFNSIVTDRRGFDPTWRQQTKECTFCGTQFGPRENQHRTIWDRREFCSRTCYVAAYRGDKHPQWKPIPEKFCKKCGVRIETRTNRQLQRRLQYCSVACRPTGDQHSSWKGGKSTTSAGYILLGSGADRIPEHRALAEKLLARKLHKDEDVHHIDLSKNHNIAKNLLVLSKSGHAKLHQELGRRYMQERGGILPPDLLALGIWLGNYD